MHQGATASELLKRAHPRENKTMKTLLAAAIAVGAFASITANAAPLSAQGLPVSTLPTPKYWECGLIQVSPPDRDRDPGMKINLSTDADNFYVSHTMVSGAQYERTEQYGIVRVWRDANFNWVGRSFKNPTIVMVGTLGQNRVTGRMQYVERIFKNNRLETTVASTCHADGDPA
jgi:hypothetical protein